MRALFVNEGFLGTSIMGHPRVADAIEAGLVGVDDVEARIRFLPAGGHLARAAEWAVPGLRTLDLDFQPSRWHLVNSERVRRLVSQELALAPADVLHVHTHSVALRLARIMERLPTLLSVDSTIRDWHRFERWRPFRRHSALALGPSLALESRAFGRAAAVVAWSDWVRRAVLHECPGANVVELHPGLDLDRFRPAERKPRTAPRVLFVGAAWEEKGGEDLLAALEQDMRAGNVELDVVTQTELAPRPGLRVHRLGSGDEKLVRLYQQADVFALPTRADAHPWVVLEAMACGVPPVVGNVGGVPDAVGDSGMVVEPGDVTGLRAALQRLLGDASLRDDLAHRARARAEERFDARLQTRALVDLMRSFT